jgi:5-methylthioadenosine/S-adenosylhomocysteine deaminase
MSEKEEAFDIIIEGGTLLTMVDGEDPLFNARISIKGDKIKAISFQEESCMPKAKVIIHAENTVILPGLINVHGHSPMTLFRGWADDIPLKTWLFDHIFPAEARYMNPDTVYWATLLATLEMIASGTTTIVDGYFFADDMARAIHKSGMRGIVAQGVLDFPAPGVPRPEKNIDIAHSFLERWKNYSDLIKPGIFCHSPITCSSRTLLKAHEISLKYDLPLQTHLSETREEVEEIQKREKKRPVFYLDDLGILGSDVIAAHAIYLDEEEIETMAKRDVKVAHCAESNMKLGSGFAPVTDMLEKGMTVGLGTDGCASNNNLDLFSEMDTVAKLAKVATLDPTKLDAKTILGMATSKGARVIGMEERLGTIEPGKQADIILVDTDSPNMVPMYNPYSQLVYSACGADVRDVLVNGKILYKDRQFADLDKDEIISRVKEISQALGYES